MLYRRLLVLPIIWIFLFSYDLMGMKLFKKVTPKNFFDIKKIGSSSSFFGTCFANNTVAKSMPFMQKRSIFNPTEYAGLDESITSEPLRDQVSLVNAISLVESDFLKNVSKFGSQEYPEVQLIKDPKLGLFNLLGNDLRDTQINPAAGLTPELTGDIVSGLVKGDIVSQPVRDNIVTRWQKAYKQKRGTNITKSTINKQLDLIIKVQDEGKKPEDQRLFPKNFATSLLLSHLYRKGTKDEALDYVRSVAKHFPDQVNLQVISQVGDRIYFTKDLNDYNKAFFGGKIKNKDFFANKEKAVASKIHTLRTQRVLPPLALQGSYGYKGKAASPDCFETAFRNVCNILLSRPEGTLFDLALIPNTVSPQKDFVDFYTKYAAYSTINTREAGQAWMDLLSGHAGIEYVRGDYEVEPLLSNAFALLNILFQTQAKDFSELGMLLSSDERTVLFVPQQENLKIVITRQRKEPIAVLLKISKRQHAWLDSSHIEDAHSNRYSSDSFDTFDYLAYGGENGGENANVNCAPLFIPKNYIRTISNTNSEKASLLIYGINGYSHQLMDVNKRSYIIEDFCRAAAKHPRILPALQELCMHAPHTDTALMASILHTMHTSGLVKNNEWFANFAMKHPMNLYAVLHHSDYEALLDTLFLQKILKEAKTMLNQGPLKYDNGRWASHFSDLVAWERALFEGIRKFYKLHIDQICPEKECLAMLQQLAEATQDAHVLTEIAEIFIANNVSDKMQHGRSMLTELVKRIAATTQDDQVLVRFTTGFIVNNLSDKLDQGGMILAGLIERIAEKITAKNINAMLQSGCNRELVGELLSKLTIESSQEMRKLAENIITYKLYEYPLFKQHLIENPYGIYAILGNVAMLSDTKNFIEPCCESYLQFAVQGPIVYCGGKYKNISDSGLIEYTNELGVSFTLFRCMGSAWSSYHAQSIRWDFITPLSFAINAYVPKATILKLLKTPLCMHLINADQHREKPNDKEKEMRSLLTRFGKVIEN